MTRQSLMLGDAVQSAVFELAAAFGKPHASFVASGMAAVETALRVLGLGSGDRVLVPVECCYTVAAGILRSGAHPVFFETGKPLVATSGDLEATALVEARAVVAVHCFGLPCDVAVLRERLPADVMIIEDASLAFGITQHASTIGAHADIVIASLGEGKPISLAEGGVVLADTDSSELLDRRSGDSRMRDSPPLPFPLSPLALCELPQAILNAKHRLVTRRDVASRLIPGLQALGFEIVNVQPGSMPGWQRIPVWAESALRRVALAANAAAGEKIAQLPHAIDVPSLPMFRGRSTRVGCDRRETDRLLLIRTEPAEAVHRWYSSLNDLLALAIKT
jgi:hypothetical protein